MHTSRSAIASRLPPRLTQSCAHRAPNVDLRANGPVKAVNSAEIMKALNGTVVLDLNNVKYSGANVSNELSKIGGFLNPSAASQSTPGITTISKMTGNIQVK